MDVGTIFVRENEFYCRWAPSLGELESDAFSIWGTLPYKYKSHKNEPTVFFGLYDLRDYIALARHKGKKYILWAGSDIRNLRANFIFNDGKLLWLSQLFSNFGYNFRDYLIKKVISKAESWVENEAEAWQLKDIGIKVKGICPSFLGNVKDYKITFKPGNKVWLSANEGRQKEYGWNIVEQIACACPKIKFHLYGAHWSNYQKLPNIIAHGRVPKNLMNKQVKNMQCGLRLNKHDGFSEVTAKAVLWGQYPITYLYFPKITQYTSDSCGFPNCFHGLQNLVKLLNKLPQKYKPNIRARNYYLKVLNQYPWNVRNVKKYKSTY